MVRSGVSSMQQPFEISGNTWHNGRELIQSSEWNRPGLGQE